MRVTRAAMKSTSRFDDLYRAHHAEVLAYFVRRIPRSDAEDAAANVFTVAWRRMDRVPEGADEIKWLFGVAHKTLSNHQRGWRRALQLKRKLAGLGSPPAVTPELQVVRSAEDEMLLQALDKLSWSDSEILRLVTWERLSHEAIGLLLGISEAAAAQRISRARRRLAVWLDKIENAHPAGRSKR